ncbi:uncharacterized protein LOC125073541 [Vanessa atalanta]|uniref:uncharacterized protein LOC125073541 n=1 Tax=Vanessa atalanta TaxID=42275 RepID=UPI001FCCCC22|nr:uncharacterized protein LOC125073541 [Vanessa atalanta]
MPAYKREIDTRDLPSEFDTNTVNTIKRIEKNTNVVGIMHFHQNNVQLCTVPESMTNILINKLPSLTSIFQHSIGEITASLNEINPVVDRIMEDDSVEGVIMTNKEGIPILTNVNLMAATNHGLGMKRLGEMTKISTKEIDIFDDVLVLRLITKKIEIIVAPNKEFNIIVMQHARDKQKINKSNKQTKIDTKKLIKQ